jgi:hypothetical protein
MCIGCLPVDRLPSYGATVQGITYLFKGRSESGAIVLVAGLYCDVISNAIVVIVWGVVLQNGKWVIALCMLLVDRLQETDV